MDLSWCASWALGLCQPRGVGFFFANGSAPCPILSRLASQLASVEVFMSRQTRGFEYASRGDLRKLYKFDSVRLRGRRTLAPLGVS